MQDIDPKILAVMDELDRLRTRDDAWQVPREEAEALYELVLNKHFKLGVEIGTSYGYSGLHFGAAMRKTGGKLHTIDINKKKFDSSRQSFEKAGLTDCIVSHFGDARTVLPTITGRFDFAFLDANKPQTREYFDLVWPRLEPGGVVLTDNINTNPELGSFVKFVRQVAGAKSSTLEIGNGVEVTIKANS
jgi:caffeoyl-CoA O-methyltransferase